MAQIIEKGSAYLVRVTWRDADGKQHKKSKGGLKTKALARKAAAEMESQKYDGLLSSQDPYIADYFRSWIELYKAQKATNATQHQYDYTAKVLAKHFPKTPISRISRHDYQRFLNEFGLTHSHETMRKLNVYISKCMAVAVANGIVSRSFTEGAEVVWNPNRTRKIEYLSMQEIATLVAALETDRQSRFVTRYMIITAAYTGMRLAEIAALTWSDLSPDFKTLTINKSWDYLASKFKATKTKGSKRIIKVNDELVDLLLELKANGSKMIFYNPTTGQVPTSAAVNKTLRKFLTKAGIDKPSFHFHSLRHSHVAYLLAKGVPLYAISKRLGHTSMTITANRYAYLIDELKAKSDQQIIEALADIGVPNGVPTLKTI